MQRLRFAVALAVLGLAATPGVGFAGDDPEQRCPLGWVFPDPLGTCGYTGHGSCSTEDCEFQCEDQTYQYSGCTVN